jgi:hypothetical protein
VRCFYIQKIGFVELYVEHVSTSASENEVLRTNDCADVYIRTYELSICDMMKL